MASKVPNQLNLNEISYCNNVFSPEIETDAKKWTLAQKQANNKNPQFLSNPANILAIFPIHELIIFTQFHNDRVKIVDFYYWLIIRGVHGYTDKGGELKNK